MNRTSLTRVGDSCPDVLNSWKEIAQYLGRGVRTVQRWESNLGMPVRRPHGRSRSSVIAICTELDEWLRSCPSEKLLDKASHAQPSLKSELVVEAERLRADLRGTRKQLRETLMSVEERVRKLLDGKGAA